LISLDLSALCKTPTWALLPIGFAGIGFMTYRRRKGAAIAFY